MACYAQNDPLNWRLLALFGAGAFVMRGAGCTINDLWDQKIDRLVERTRNRPLASGKLNTMQALRFLGLQLSVGLLILLNLNKYSIGLGAASILPVAVYPLMKRITHWPQLVLGLTFNWGALLGWSAHVGTLEPYTAIPVYAAGICWTLVYDTIYALQDVQDDLRANVKSTAILFGRHLKLCLSAFAFSSIGLFLYSGHLNGMGAPYYTGIAVAACHLLWQVVMLRREDPKDCMQKFKSNRWLGAVVFVGIAADLLHQRPALSAAYL